MVRYAGNYDDYRAQRGRRRRGEGEPRRAVRRRRRREAKEAPPAASAGQGKLTWAEQKELDGLLDRIEAAEQAVAGLEAEALGSGALRDARRRGRRAHGRAGAEARGGGEAVVAVGGAGDEAGGGWEGLTRSSGEGRNGGCLAVREAGDAGQRPAWLGLASPTRSRGIASFFYRQTTPTPDSPPLSLSVSAPNYGAAGLDRCAAPWPAPSWRRRLSPGARSKRCSASSTQLLRRRRVHRAAPSSRTTRSAERSNTSARSPAVASSAGRRACPRAGGR